MKKEYFLQADILREFITAVFTKAGVPKSESRVCADVLVESDLRGIDSHGVNRLKPIYIDRIADGILNPKTNFEIVKQTSTTAVVDGHNGMGMVIAKKCMNMAIKKAKKHGMGLVVARNSTHFGIAGYYAMMASKEGLIGQVSTNARPSIAPTFGVENMLGTNPLTYAVPTDEKFDFVLDFATSVTQRGKIEYYDRLGLATPEGLVIGNDGKYRTDTKQILKDLNTGEAALVPIGGIGEETGGYKGYCYATLVEILSSALQAGNFLHALSGIKDGKKVPIELGHFFLAINVESFIDLPSFRKNVGSLLRELRASKKAPGEDRIYTAGEKEYISQQKREKKGIPIPEEVQNELVGMRDKFGLKKFKFEWE